MEWLVSVGVSWCRRCPVCGSGGGRWWARCIVSTLLIQGVKISQAELVRIRLDRRVCGCVVVWVMPIVRQWRWRVEDHMLCVNCFLLGVSTAQTELVRTCWEWRVCGGAPSHLFFGSSAKKIIFLRPQNHTRKNHIKDERGVAMQKC